MWISIRKKINMKTANCLRVKYKLSGTKFNSTWLLSQIIENDIAAGMLEQEKDSRSGYPPGLLLGGWREAKALSF